MPSIASLFFCSDSAHGMCGEHDLFIVRIFLCQVSFKSMKRRSGRGMFSGDFYFREGSGSTYETSQMDEQNVRVGSSGQRYPGHLNPMAYGAGGGVPKSPVGPQSYLSIPNGNPTILSSASSGVAGKLMFGSPSLNALPGQGVPGSVFPLQPLLLSPSLGSANAPHAV